MSSELWIGFFLGMISAFIVEFILYLFKRELYDKRLLRRKYKKLLGDYYHENGTIKMVHLQGNRFQAQGKENSGFEWISNLVYHDNSIFTGVYDWSIDSDSDIWGEHYLHVLPHGDISVIWNDKNQEKTGRLTWKRTQQPSKKSKTEKSTKE